MTCVERVLACCLFIGLLRIKSCLGARGCPLNTPRNKSKIALSNMMGNISPNTVLFSEGDDKCDWEIRPPSTSEAFMLTVNVTNANCTEKFEIHVHGKEKVNICGKDKPYIYTVIPTSCIPPCLKDDKNCQVGYPLKIKYENKPKSNGFTLYYEFSRCGPTTIAPTSDAQHFDTSTGGTVQATIAPTSDAQLFDTSTDGTVQATIAPTSDAQLFDTSTGGTVKATIAPTSDAQLFDTSTGGTVKETPSAAHERSTTTDTTNSSTPKTAAASLIISIFVPVVVILIVGIIVLLVIMRIRHKTLNIEKAITNNQLEGGNPPPSSINAISSSASGNAFGNQAYQTVIAGGDQTNAYAAIDDGAVYYSPVNGEVDNTGKIADSTNTYDQIARDATGPQNGDGVNNYEEVALEAPKNDGSVNNYEEVTLQGPQNDDDDDSGHEFDDDDMSSEEHEIVDNVLYGQNN